MRMRHTVQYQEFLGIKNGLLRINTEDQQRVYRVEKYEIIHCMHRAVKKFDQCR